MDHQKYSQVSADGDENDNTIELTGLPNRNQSFDEEGEGDEDCVLPDEFSDDDGYDNDDDDDDENRTDGFIVTGGHTRIPMEVIEEQLLWNVVNRWEEPSLLSIVVTAFVLIPTLVLWMYGAFEFAGKWWAIWILVLHLQMRLSVSTWYIKSTFTVTFAYRRSLRVLCSFVSLFELAMCGVIYPKVCYILIETFFRDVDETIVQEWRKETRFMLVGVLMGWLVVILRCCIGLPCLAIRAMKYKYPEAYREYRPTYWTPLGEEGSLQDGTRYKLYSTFRFLNFFVFGLNVICILSLLSHFGPWPPGLALPENCNDLDETECALPFPSFHHMRADTTSPTGWRVDLKGLPPLRGGIPFHLKFLHELDGFSTMGPILFYMEGLKEADENKDYNRYEMQGPENIASSVTRKSITVLVDVKEHSLVHHSAEVDCLDPEHPVVMMFPAEPLKHNTHYAVGVISAMDKHGRRLPRTKGMIKLMKATNSKTRARFVNDVIPAVDSAVPWFSFKKDPESLQLLFDFVTVSEESQLGPVRAARDIALEHIEKWDWDDRVRVVSVANHDCDEDSSSVIARTVHLSLDVPSFLRHESRYSFLDPNKIQRKHGVTIGEARATVEIPCSLMKETLEESSGNKLRAVVEYGHGLFGNREEMRDYFLQKMGNDNGYIMMGMDWRGMSRVDVPVVIRALLGQPVLFQAIRDNLIQGFANRICLQHFSQNGMLNLEVFKFRGNSIPTLNGDPPTSAFYGISQGGILGAGYMSLVGKTKLIERGILGSPGSPFNMVLTRSLDFAVYDKILLLNYYNNRHVRIALALMQMAWDPTEASGLQARPVSEPIPQLLIQAGLGDPNVPTLAAESLARAMGASVLPGNPRSIFGLPTESAATNEWSGPEVALSELLYEREYNALPIDNNFFGPESHDILSANHVHSCLRWDSSMIEQIEEFVNTGRVIDPCRNDQCRRVSCE